MVGVDNETLMVLFRRTMARCQGATVRFKYWLVSWRINDRYVADEIHARFTRG